MSGTFTNQMTFGWVDEATTAAAPTIVSETRQKPATVVFKSSRPKPTKRAAGTPVTAKPMEELVPALSAKMQQRRNRTDHISDLLLVVLDNYGIDANEFLEGLDK